MANSSSSLLDMLRVPTQPQLTGSLLVHNLDDIDRKWKISVAILSDEALYLLQPPSTDWIIIPLIHATAEPGSGNGSGSSSVSDVLNLTSGSGLIFTMHTARISFTFKAPSERSAKGWIDAINELSEIANDNALLAAPEHLAEDLLESAFAQPLIELEAKCEAAERLKLVSGSEFSNSTSSPPSSRPRKLAHSNGRHMDVLKAALPPSSFLIRAALELFPIFSIHLVDLLEKNLKENNKKKEEEEEEEEERALFSFHWGLSSKPPQSLQRLQTLATAESLLMVPQTLESILSPSLVEINHTSNEDALSSSSYSSLQSVPSPLLLEAAYISCSSPNFVSRSFKLRYGKGTRKTQLNSINTHEQQVKDIQESPTNSIVKKSILGESPL
jgi:hypothetical protein